MKTKSFVFCCLCIVLLICNACENPFSNTPDEDTTMLWPASDSTGLWGYINEKGEMVIPAQFDYASGFSCGKAKVRFDYSRFAYIDKHGNKIHTFSEMEEGDDYFYYGCCRLYKYMGHPMRSQPVAMLDDNFNIIFQTDYFYYFLNPMTKDGLAFADFRYYNKRGEIVFPKENDSTHYYYREGIDFCDGIAVVIPYWKDKDGFLHYINGAINTKGDFVIDTAYYFLQSVGCNRLVYQLEKEEYTYSYPLLGLMDTEGNIITEPFIEKAYISFFGDGDLMPVYSNGKNGYIDKNGTWQIPAQYDRAYPFYEGVAWVLNREDGWKLIDLKGNVVLALDDVNKSPNGMFHNGLCLIWDSTNRQNMYINKQGEVIYSWTAKSAKKQSNSLEKTDPSSFDYDEMLLRLFEGTNYYPLAEQSLRSRKLNN